MRNYLVWSLVLPAHAGAELVLFSAPEAPRLEYRAAVEANPDAETPVDAWRAQYAKSTARREFHEALVKRFERAQRAYLAFNIEDARREFALLADEGRREDLTRGERELVVNSLLRLAQIEGENGAASASWLGRSLNYLADVTIDRKIFPPPLLARLQKLRLETKRRRPRVALGDSEWTLVLVNGQPCDAAECPEVFVTPDPVRITYLSDRYLPQTVVATLEVAEELRPKKIPWLTGACGHATFHARAKALGQTQAFWSFACEKSVGSVSVPVVIAAEPPVTSVEPNLHPIEPSPVVAGEHVLDRPAAAAAVNSIPGSGEPPRRGGWIRSKWFWLGIGGVALTGLVVASRSHPREHIVATDND